RARGVVVSHVLGEYAQQLPRVEDDQVVEALSAQGADPTLSDGVRLGRLDRREQASDPQSRRPRDEVAMVTAVAVTDQVPRLPTPWRRGDQLTPDPFRGGVHGDVQVHEAPPLNTIL